MNIFVEKLGTRCGRVLQWGSIHCSRTKSRANITTVGAIT